MIFGLIPSYRNKRLKAAHYSNIRRLHTQPGFASQEAKSESNALLGDWIDIAHGKHVLEVGCGPGRYVAMLAALDFDVVGIDRHEFETWSDLKLLSNVRLYKEVLAEKLPFPDQSFDHVCFIGTLHYVENPITALSEIHRVLKPGGRLLLRSVNSNNPYTRVTGKRLDPVSKNLYNKREITTLIENTGFELARYFSFGFLPPIFSNYFWYLDSVHIGHRFRKILSDCLPEQYRHNHIIHATRT